MAESHFWRPEYPTRRPQRVWSPGGAKSSDDSYSRISSATANGRRGAEKTAVVARNSKRHSPLAQSLRAPNPRDELPAPRPGIDDSDAPTAYPETPCPGCSRPLTLRDVTFRNRVFVSPMCLYSSVDGMPNDWHMVHLGSRAVGGAGLVMVEATAVSPEGRISPDDSGLWSEAHADAFAPHRGLHRDAGRGARHPARARRPQGVDTRRRGRAAAARRGGGGWMPVAPSAIPFIATDRTRRARSRPSRSGRDRSEFACAAPRLRCARASA